MEQIVFYCLNNIEPKFCLSKEKEGITLYPRNLLLILQNPSDTAEYVIR